MSIPIAEKARARKITVTRADAPAAVEPRTIEGDSSDTEHKAVEQLTTATGGAGPGGSGPSAFQDPSRRRTAMTDDGDPLRRLDDPDFPALTMSQAAELLGVQAAFLRSLDASACPAAVPVRRRAPPLLRAPAGAGRPAARPARRRAPARLRRGDRRPAGPARRRPRRRRPPPRRRRSERPRTSLRGNPRGVASRAAVRAARSGGPQRPVSTSRTPRRREPSEQPKHRHGTPTTSTATSTARTTTSSACAGSRARPAACSGWSRTRSTASTSSPRSRP